MHDDVFDEWFGDLNQLKIKDDDALCRAASPAFLHEADFEWRLFMDAHDCGAFHAFSEQFGKNFFGFLPIPAIQLRFNRLSVFFVGRDEHKTPAHERQGRRMPLQHLQAILLAQI